MAFLRSELRDRSHARGWQLQAMLALTLRRRPRGHRAAAPLQCSAPPLSPQRTRTRPAASFSFSFSFMRTCTRLERTLTTARYGVPDISAERPPCYELTCFRCEWMEGTPRNHAACSRIQDWVTSDNTYTTTASFHLSGMLETWKLHLPAVL